MELEKHGAEVLESSKIIERYEIEKPMSVNDLIRSDQRRFKEAGEVIARLGFHAALFCRLSHYFSTIGALFAARSIQLMSHLITGAEISHRAVIGPGLVLLHPTGIVIGPNVKIGKRAIICQGVTISTNYELLEAGIEAETVIGDDLWAGPNCAIMGPLLMGDHVFVGPNAVVNRAVNSYMKAIGNPARLMPTDSFHITPIAKK